MDTDAPRSYARRPGGKLRCIARHRAQYAHAARGVGGGPVTVAAGAAGRVIRMRAMGLTGTGYTRFRRWRPTVSMLAGTPTTPLHAHSPSPHRAPPADWICRPMTGNGTLIGRAIMYLHSCTKRTYRGRRHGMLELLGRKVTWQAVQHWCAGRHPMPAWAADTLADSIEVQARVGLQLVSDLREHATAMRARPRVPRGWQVVREHDDNALHPWTTRFRG
jgi:hypothetical protein